MPSKSEKTKTVKNNKKTRKELEIEIIEEINNSMKEEITQDIVHEIKKSIDREYKDEIKNEIRTEIIDDIKKDIQKEQKKLSRSKTFKIFRLYLYLLVVVACLLFILYRLYTTDNLTIINKKIIRPTNTTITVNANEKVTEEVKDLEYYTRNYGYLLENLKISNVELVRGNYNFEEISLTDRLTLAYGSLNDEDIILDGIIHSVSEDKMRETYQTLFGTLDGYNLESFVVRGLNYAYSSVTNSYMAVGNEDATVSYVNNIVIDIREEGETIVFDAKAYVIKNNYVYSANNLNSRLMSADEDMDLSKIQNRLTSVEYRFTKAENGYRLVSISKK
ncbi:MAG: hypothetical protein J1F35_07805 [Erysipelotrichales bacterium]|nr:hypothetical protein [Erysipelotrichales bacterium]